jgi:uncharacterized protein (TIGR02246 family)
MSETASAISAEKIIRLAVEEFTRAYNTGDLEHLADIFAEDLVDMSAGEPVRTGEDARKDFVSRVATTHAKFRPRLEIHIDELRVTGEWAYQRGRLLVTLIPKEGGDTSFIHQRYLEIWKREASGKWKIAIEMDNSEED